MILPECVFSIPVKFEFFFSRAPIKTFFFKLFHITYYIYSP